MNHARHRLNRIRRKLTRYSELRDDGADMVWGNMRTRHKRAFQRFVRSTDRHWCVEIIRHALQIKWEGWK